MKRSLIAGMAVLALLAALPAAQAEDTVTVNIT